MSNQDIDHNLDPPSNSEDSSIPLYSEDSSTYSVASPPPSFPFQRSLRRWIVPLILGLLVLGGMGLVLLKRVILPALMFSQMSAPSPISVPLSPVKATAIEDSSDHAVTLDPRQSMTIRPKVSGRVLSLYVKTGDRVEAGKKLLQIDADEQRVLMASRRTGMSAAVAEMEAAKIDITNAEETFKLLKERQVSAQANVQSNQEDYKRFENLFRAGATSKQSLDQKRSAIQATQTELNQANTDVQAQQSAIARAKAQVVRNQQALVKAKASLSEGNAQLRNYTITAPFSGVVGNVSAKLGAIVNSRTPLLTITQNEKLEVQFQVPLERSSNLRRGQLVKLLDDKNKAVRSGQISFIAPAVDPAAQSVQAKAAFTNVGDVLRTSRFVRARVVWNAHSGLLVPTTAISNLEGKDYIFVAQPFQSSGCKATVPQGSPLLKIESSQIVADKQSIQLGKMMGTHQEVLEGLSPGDRIVTSGVLQLQNCLPIAAVTPFNPG
jgi:RND family efflux transporter MFP subunit